MLLCTMLFALLAWAIMATVSSGARQAMVGRQERSELERIQAKQQTGKERRRPESYRNERLEHAEPGVQRQHHHGAARFDRDAASQCSSAAP